MSLFKEIRIGAVFTADDLVEFLGKFSKGYHLQIRRQAQEYSDGKIECFHVELSDPGMMVIHQYLNSKKIIHTIKKNIEYSEKKRIDRIVGYNREKIFAYETIDSEPFFSCTEILALLKDGNMCNAINEAQSNIEEIPNFHFVLSIREHLDILKNNT